MIRIDHINRYVSNVEQFINFYQNVLDYMLIDRGMKDNGHKYAIMKGEGHELFLSEKENFTKEDITNFRHIGYSVENADILLNDLKNKGYIGKEQEIIVKSYSRQFYIEDPDGIVLDLIQWTDKKGFYNSLKYN